MNLFRIAGATTIGTSHIKNGKPCQDKIYSKKSNHVAAIAGGIATLLLIDEDIFYAGIGYGYAIREFFLAFKK